MKKKLDRLWSVVVIVSLCLQLNIAKTDSFADSMVNTGARDLSLCASFSKDAVSRLYTKGIIMGDSQGRINPKENVTRAQAVAFIVRALGLALENPPEPTFSDSNPTHWAYRYIETAYRYGITSGTSKNTFLPDRDCSREELVAMLMRAVIADTVALGLDDTDGILRRIKDADQLSPWARESAAFAYSKNILSGYNNYISPKSTATREQAAVILDNYLMLYTPGDSSSASSKSIFSPGDIAALKKSVVTIHTYDKNGMKLAQGSGFCVGTGLFLTNFHVLEYASSFKVATDDGVWLDTAGIVKYDKEKDLAIIKTAEPTDIQPLAMGTKETVSPGDAVLAIGSPYGLQNTVSDGIISGVRSNLGVTLIQTTAPITHGSSGGPLFDRQLRVIGITSSGYDSGSLNFAVAIDYIFDWVEALKTVPFSEIPVYDQNAEFGDDLDFAVSGIKYMINTLFQALESENAEKYRSVFDSDSMVVSTANTVLGPLFHYYDLDYTVESINVTRLISGFARAEVLYHVRKTAGQDYRDREMIGTYNLEDIDGWRITSADESLVKYLEPLKAPPVVSSFVMNLEVTDAVMDPDRPVVYIAQRDSGKIFAVNYETRKVDELSLPLKPWRLKFANGKLYVALQRFDTERVSWYGSVRNGAIGIIDPSTFELIKQFDIGVDPYALEVDDKGHIFVNSALTWPGMRSYSEETGKEISLIRGISEMGEMKLNAAMDTLYFVSKYGGMQSCQIDSNGNLISYKDDRSNNTFLKSNFGLSPDGRYIFNGSGKIFTASFGYVAQLNKYFHDIAFDSENNLIYAGVDTNLINVYDGRTFKSINSYKLTGKPIKVFYRDGKLASVTYSGGRYYMESLIVN